MFGGSERQIFRAKALERISSPDDLDEMIQVVGPKEWVPVAVLALLLALALAWSFAGRLPVTVSAAGILVSSDVSPALRRPDGAPDPMPVRAADAALVNVSYFDIGTGQRIRPGMRVQVIPDAIERQRYGGITGVVMSVSDGPATLEEATQRVGNPNLAGEFLGGGPRVEVIARLDTDGTAASGYRWSSSRGPRLGLRPGLMTSMRVRLETRRPITHVVAFVRAVMAGDGP
jgi:hypothetical protein